MSVIHSEEILHLGNIDKEKLCPIKNKVALSFKMIINHSDDWEKCIIISDFFSDYYTSTIVNKKKEISLTLSTIINELIENAVKHSTKEHNEISIHLKKFDKEVLIIIENIATKEKVNNLIHTLNLINSKDTELLMLNRIKNNLLYHQENSEIGLLNIINYYTTNIGAKVIPLKNTKLSKIEFYVSLKHD